MSTINRYQQSVIVEIAKAKQSGQNPLIITDIDNTIIDPSERALASLKHVVKKWAAERVDRRWATDNLQRIIKIVPSLRALNVLKLVGFSGSIPEEPTVNCFLDVCLSETFLHLDTEIPGTCGFLKSCIAVGAKILYLSARPEGRMLNGTIMSLQNLGFPVDPSQSEFLLCSATKGSTQTAKCDRVARRQFSTDEQVLAIFDDNPFDLGALGKLFPSASFFLVETSNLLQPFTKKIIRDIPAPV